MSISTLKWKLKTPITFQCIVQHIAWSLYCDCVIKVLKLTATKIRPRQPQNYPYWPWNSFCSHCRGYLQTTYLHYVLFCELNYISKNKWILASTVKFCLSNDLMRTNGLDKLTHSFFVIPQKMLQYLTTLWLVSGTIWYCSTTWWLSDLTRL